MKKIMLFLIFHILAMTLHSQSTRIINTGDLYHTYFDFPGVPLKRVEYEAKGAETENPIYISQVNGLLDNEIPIVYFPSIWAKENTDGHRRIKIYDSLIDIDEEYHGLQEDRIVMTGTWFRHKSETADVLVAWENLSGGSYSNYYLILNLSDRNNITYRGSFFTCYFAYYVEQLPRITINNGKLYFVIADRPTEEEMDNLHCSYAISLYELDLSAMKLYEIPDTKTYFNWDKNNGSECIILERSKNILKIGN